MATVIFYEKPGCINNTKQKTLLEAAGHSVQERNLLTEHWTAEGLRSFFGMLPVADWFNRSAPRIKSGEIVPEKLEAETALALMIDQPLLIRRPLMQVGQQRSIGFEIDVIDAWIGLKPFHNTDDLQTCPRNHEDAPCRPKV